MIGIGSSYHPFGGDTSSGVVRYWALVTDVNLKDEMNGWDLTRQVRETDPAFPVVYMAGPVPTNGPH